MQIADRLASRRIDPQVVVVRRIAIANPRLRDNHPGIVMAEDPCIFLVSRRIRRNLSKLDVVLRISRLLQHDAVLGSEMLPHRIERRLRAAVLQANSGQRTIALRLDKDFALFVFLRAYLAPKVVVRADEPLAVPSVLADRLFHLRNFGKECFFASPSLPRCFAIAANS